MGWQDDPVVASVDNSAAPWQNDPVVSAGPTKIGADAFPDFLKSELANAGWFGRNLAAFGTAASDLYQGAKQFIGQGDQQAIQANKIIRQSAPVGAIAGDVALSAIPFGLAGNTVKGAAKVGAVFGALQPVEGDQTASNIIQGKLVNTGIGGLSAAGGQAIANGAGALFNKAQEGMALLKAQNAPLTKTLNDALDAGLVVSPSSVEPSLFNRALESVGGKVATAQQVSNRNADVIANLVRQDLGMAPNEPLTSEAMKQIRAREFNAGYAPIANQPEMPVSQAYNDALTNLVSKYSKASESFPGVASPDLQVLVDSYRPNGSQFSPGALQAQGLQTAAEVAANREASRIAALQEAGKLQTAAAEASTRANNFVPVPGMPRVPASLSPNLDRAQEYAAAVPDALALVSQRAAERDAVNALGQRLQNAGSLPTASFDPEHALIATSVLRDQAREAFRQGSNQVGLTKRAIANEIENEVERQLQAQGQPAAALLDRFRQARTLMAKAHDVEDAIVEGGGSIDPRVLARKFQNQEPLSGSLATIGAFANNFPKATQPAKLVAGPAISKLDFALATGGALAGGTADGKEGSILGAIAPFLVPRAARARLLSQGSQNALRDIYQLGLAPRVANSLVQYAPVGGAVLGLNAFSQ